MNVYVVTEGEEYEYTDVIGVYSTLNRAQEAVEQYEIARTYVADVVITPHKLNGPCKVKR